MAALRAYDTSPFGATVPQFLTAGYYAPGDQGGNQFYWSSSSTAADNGGTIIKPTGVPIGSPGRWLAAGGSTLNARAFGAKGDGVTDETVAINAAVTNAQSSGLLGSVYFPRGTYKITSSIVITNPVRLIGEGAGGYPGSSPGTYSKLLWAGPSSGTMLTMSHLVYDGHGIERLQLDGGGQVPDVLLIDGSEGGLYTDLVVSGVGTGSGIKMTGSGLGTGLTCSWNTFRNTFIEGIGNGKSCLWLTGVPVPAPTPGWANACHNTFTNTKLTHTGNRPAIVLGGCDNNVFISTYIYRAGDTSTGLGVLTDPGEKDQLPIGNLFLHLQAGHGGWVTAPGSASMPAAIFGYERDNEQPPPVLNGQRLLFTDSFGAIAPPTITANTSVGTSTFYEDASGGTQLTIGGDGRKGNPFGNTNNFAGMFMVSDPTISGSMGVFVAGSSGVVMLGQSGLGANFSTLPGTLGKSNVYLNAAPVNAVEIENKTGFSIDYRVVAFRMRTSP